MSAFEYKFATLFACGPAIRQLFMYRHRTKTFLPTKARQYPNEDFEKMRWRINVRDILWYRKPAVINGRVFEAQRTFLDTRSTNDLDRSGVASQSALSLLERRVRNFFHTGRFTNVRRAIDVVDYADTNAR